MPVKMPETLKYLSEKAKKSHKARKIKGSETSVQLMDKTDIVFVKTDRFHVFFTFAKTPRRKVFQARKRRQPLLLILERTLTSRIWLFTHQKTYATIKPRYQADTLHDTKTANF